MRKYYTNIFVCGSTRAIVRLFRKAHVTHVSRIYRHVWIAFSPPHRCLCACVSVSAVCNSRGMCPMCSSCRYIFDWVESEFMCANVCLLVSNMHLHSFFLFLPMLLRLLLQWWTSQNARLCHLSGSDVAHLHRHSHPKVAVFNCQAFPASAEKCLRVWLACRFFLPLPPLYTLHMRIVMWHRAQRRRVSVVPRRGIVWQSEINHAVKIPLIIVYFVLRMLSA